MSASVTARARAARTVELKVDGERCRSSRASTILDACRAPGSTPRRSATARPCTPVNVCRVCVVEVEGSRVLVPSCSRKVEPGMVVRTDSERVRHSPQARARVPGLVRRPLDHAGRPRGTLRRVRRRARAVRPARAAATTATATARGPGHHAPPDGRTAATVAPAGQGRQRALRPRLRQVHPLLQVRRGLRRAAPEHLRASRVAGRGFDARISTEFAVAAPRVGLRVLRQLHRRLPDRRADVQDRARPARGRHVGRVTADRHRHDLPVLRRRLHARAARAGQRDREGHLARPTTTSPAAISASRAASASSTSRPATRSRFRSSRAPAPRRSRRGWWTRRRASARAARRARSARRRRSRRRSGRGRHGGRCAPRVRAGAAPARTPPTCRSAARARGGAPRGRAARSWRRPVMTRSEVGRSRVPSGSSAASWFTLTPTPQTTPPRTTRGGSRRPSPRRRARRSAT